MWNNSSSLLALLLLAFFVSSCQTTSVELFSQLYDSSVKGNLAIRLKNSYPNARFHFVSVAAGSNLRAYYTCGTASCPKAPEIISYEFSTVNELSIVLENASTQPPSTSTQEPSTSTQEPSTSTQEPSTSTQEPSTSTQEPSTHTQGPTTDSTSVLIHFTSTGSKNDEEIISRAAETTSYDPNLITLTDVTSLKRDSYTGTLNFFSPVGSTTSSASYEAAGLFVSAGDDALGDGYSVSSTFLTFAAPIENECNTQDPTACSAALNGSACYEVNNTAGFCNCFSGFSGKQCQYNSTSWNPNEVSFSFVPDVQVSAGNDVSFEVKIPSVHNQYPLRSRKSFGTITVIQFGASNNSRECDYPHNANWNITSGADGYDTYQNVYTYAQLNSCGLNGPFNGTDGEYATYNDTISITKSYRMVDPNRDGISLKRKASIENKFAILFPQKVSVSTSVNLTANEVMEFAAVTETDYDPITDKWSFTFVAITTAPYKLSYTAGSATVTRGDGSRVDTTLTLLPCDPVVTNAEHCQQKFKIEASGCQSLDFALLVPLNVTCRGAGLCSLPTNTTFDPLFEIMTQNTCPLEQKVPITSLELNTFTNDSLVEQKDVFGTSETVYFGISFSSVADIAGVTVEATCVGNITTACPVGSTRFARATVTPSGGFEGLNVSDVPLRFGFSAQASDIATAFGGTGSIVVQADFTITFGSGFSNKRSVRFASSKVGSSIQIRPSGKQSARPQVIPVHQESSSATSAQSFALLIGSSLAVLVLVL